MSVPDEDYFLFRFVILLLVSFHYFSFRFVSVSKISYWVVCFQEIIIFWKKIVVGCFIHPYRHISFTENTLVKENRTRLDTKFKGINCTYSQLITSIYTFNSENFTLYLQFSLECVQNEHVILSTIQLQFIFHFVM
jgi:hypothetical protein